MSKILTVSLIRHDHSPRVSPGELCRVKTILDGRVGASFLETWDTVEVGVPRDGTSRDDGSGRKGGTGRGSLESVRVGQQYIRPMPGSKRTWAFWISSRSIVSVPLQPLLLL